MDGSSFRGYKVQTTAFWLLYCFLKLWSRSDYGKYQCASRMSNLHSRASIYHRGVASTCLHLVTHKDLNKCHARLHSKITTLCSPQTLLNNYFHVVRHQMYWGTNLKQTMQPLVERCHFQVRFRLHDVRWSLLQETQPANCYGIQQGNIHQC